MTVQLNLDLNLNLSDLLKQLPTLLVRVRTRRSVTPARRKRLIKAMCRDMLAMGFAMVESQGWCVLTPLTSDDPVFSRHDVLNWLIDHNEFDKYMLVAPQPAIEFIDKQVVLQEPLDEPWHRPAAQGMPEPDCLDLVSALTCRSLMRNAQLVEVGA
jgi:hypothetical protein